MLHSFKKKGNAKESAPANKKAQIAIFDFTSCEGDQLQIINLEEGLLEILQHAKLRLGVLHCQFAYKHHCLTYKK